MSRYRSRTRAARLALSILAAPLVLSPIMGAPAYALTVFDPWNYSQNILTAARTLQQITNQITALQNQAQMLINQARNLANLPYSALQQIQQSVQRTQQLLTQAQNIAFDVQKIDQAFQTTYGSASFSLRPATDRGRPRALAEHCRWLARCHARPGRRRRQHRH